MAMLRRLADESFDLIVIGGGITGGGIAREAALRGLHVALIEGADFGHGTSSRSTKLIHGGLRYLKNLELRLVRESVAERLLLLSMAPHLVKLTPFLFPVYDGDPDGLFKLNLGLTLYDWFAGHRNPMPHRMREPQAVLEAEPLVRPEGLRGGALYGDCRTNDGRLTFEVIGSAVTFGAVAANYLKVDGFLKDGRGAVYGVRVLDGLAGATLEIRASTVLIAAGPWADQVRRLDEDDAPPVLRLTSGVHLTVPQERLPVKHAVVIRGPDGRMMFTVPAGAYTYIGTTDVDYDGDPGSPEIRPVDARYILNAAARAFPEAHLEPGDVVSAWIGLRPLLRVGKGANPSAASRDYKLFRSRSGLITVGGGKLTAFRAMAAHIVDTSFPATRRRKQISSSTEPLLGAAGPLPTDAQLAALAAQTGISPAQARLLGDFYGAKLPEVLAFMRDGAGEQALLRARVRYAVQAEMAVRLEDILARRTDLLLFSPDNGARHLDLIAGEMGALLGWSGEQTAREVERVCVQIRAMHQWRSE